MRKKTFLRNCIHELKVIFSSLPNQPIPLFGANYQVGDTWDKTMVHLLNSSSQCFSNLTIRSNPFTIPQFHSNKEAAAGFVLRLKKLFELGGSADHAGVVDIYFDDVTEEIVALGDLKENLNSRSCPDLQPVLQNGNVSDNPPVVIGALYKGKRRVLLAYSDDAAANAKLTELITLGQADLGINIKLATGRIISFEDRAPVALAYLPAVIPVATSGSHLGGSTDSVNYQWTPLDLHRYPMQSEALDELASEASQHWWTSSAGN